MIIHDVDQRSDEWFSMRAGLPTASEFKKILTSKGEPSKSAPEYAGTLAAELYAGRPVDAFEGNVWTERGNEMEDEAICAYELIRDVSVERVGFVTDDDKKVGCSPDGFVGKDGLVEIKCLMAKNHVQAILHYEKNKKPKSDYIAQPQGQMMVCEREWCDLFFYHPVLPPLIIRQFPDTRFEEALPVELDKLRVERDRVFSILQSVGNGPEKKTA